MPQRSLHSLATSSIFFQLNKPDASLTNFVESYWMLQNNTDTDKEIVVLPDGRIDLTFSTSSSEAFHVIRSGLETLPQVAHLKAHTLIFAVSFKLLATEYIFRTPISPFVNFAEFLPDDFWGFGEDDLASFDTFCQKANHTLQTLIPQDIDARKRQLFDLIYSSKGEITVKSLTDQVKWSSRQMNRYFNDQFGVSLKTYCNILRFRASFPHIKEGKLFPEQNFADQSHFIKEVKKFAGVSPKELKHNLNDRFIQFSALLSE